MPIANTHSLGAAFTQPLSDSQREIWFAAQMGDAASAAFNQSCVVELRGELDNGALSDALDDLVASHDALRTTFSPSGDEQRVHAELPLFCPVLDLSGQQGATREERIQHRLRSEVQTPFDLTKGPMIRAALMKLEEREHLFVITVHHLICDGTSLNMLPEELAEKYSARRRAGTAAAKESGMQFSQFVAQQLQFSSNSSEPEEYWVKQFESPATYLELPTDRARPKVRTFIGGGGHLKLEPGLSQEFRRMAAKNRCTLFAASLAAFYVLLHRLSGQTDLVVGVPMSARVGERGHEVIGHCVNFLPLRLRVGENPSFTEHLANTRGMLLDALDHVQYNFGRLIRKLNLPRRPTRAPVVSTMFNVDHIKKGFEAEGLEMEVRPNPYCLANFDFSLSLEEHEGELEAHCLYSADMLETGTVARWLRHFQTLLQSIVANPQCRIGELRMLTAGEEKMILSCSGTEEHLIHDLLPEEIAGLTPPGTPELEMYVLEGHGQLAVPGVTGELCIARLPVNKAAVPASNLVSSPCGAHNGELLFRTGYRAKYLASGDIEILDLSRLKENVATRQTSRTATPRSDVQDKLADIWREVMRLDAIETNDDFFELGGHSLLVTQIIARVRSSFGVQLTLRNFFETPTIGELTRAIEEQIVTEVQKMPDSEAERLAAELV